MYLCIHTRLQFLKHEIACYLYILKVGIVESSSKTYKDLKLTVNSFELK